MGKMYITLIILAVNIGVFAGLVINCCRLGICYYKKNDIIRVLCTLRKNGLLMVIMIPVLVVFIWITQILAHTPKIKNEDGIEVEGSISELIKVEVNNHKEWISIRGRDKEAPVLLFLAGGPGGTQMASTRYNLQELEKYFVVVNWDQPGSGKSYRSMKKEDIRVQTYIDDGIGLTEYLKNRFNKEKIYLLGESWGSALGIFLTAEKPEYYAGVIGAGQMVDFAETEIMDYNKALEIARENNDKNKVSKLINQGSPLYYRGNVALKSANYLNYLSAYMSSNPEIENGGYNTFREMFSSEYGILDSLDFLLGLMNTFNRVYPQLYDVDLREQYRDLEVPVYFFTGRHDINAPTELVESYYEVLAAPDKEIIWFEHSGHTPVENETDLFVKETVRVFLGGSTAD